MNFKYKSEVIGNNGISARIVAKSKSAYSDTVIPTWEYDAPKCILAELNTHGMLVKNAQSSRAVPVKKVIEQIRNNPVTPVHWGSNQAGMVAGEEINNDVGIIQDRLRGSDEGDHLSRDEAWLVSADIVADVMTAWEEAGYHKQIVNRIGEAFTMVRGVITGTEIDNFFHLRYHKDADPYIQELARCMWEAYEQAETEVLYEGEWHTPYVDHKRNVIDGTLVYGYSGTESGMVYEDSSSVHITRFKCVTLEEALKISAAACGQVSYRKLDLSEETVDRVWNRLMTGDIIHASVTGHQATPMQMFEYPYGEGMNAIDCFTEKGKSHMDSNGQFWSAQFKHWIMHRKLIPNESFKGKFVPPVGDNK